LLPAFRAHRRTVVLAFVDVINCMEMLGDEAATELVAMVSEYFSLDGPGFLV
jgi:hypothetical protein